MKKEEKTIKAFANISRLRILQFLKKEKSASVGEIHKATKFSYKAVSKHLAILYQADVVEREQKMAEVYYSISKTANSLTTSILRHL